MYKIASYGVSCCHSCASSLSSFIGDGEWLCGVHYLECRTLIAMHTVSSPPSLKLLYIVSGLWKAIIEGQMPQSAAFWCAWFFAVLSTRRRAQLNLPPGRQCSIYLPKWAYLSPRCATSLRQGCVRPSIVHTYTTTWQHPMQSCQRLVQIKFRCTNVTVPSLYNLI
jgi:hypothetical protein